MFTSNLVKILAKSMICLTCMILLFNVCVAAKETEKLNVYSQAYIAYDRVTKNVMFGKNIDKKVAMASTTKIMTAILTIEYGNLNEYVIATQNAQNITGWQLNIKKGDKILLKDLLYAIMLYSANDGAVAIAEHIGGSVEEFCKMMNDKAKEIGAINTNFTSPHGLDNSNHYSTPYDLAIIMDYALNNELFRKVISTPSYVINISGKNRNVNNTNKLIHSLDGCVGGKTGYTGKAGYCLVSNCKRENMDVIGVVLGAGTTNQRFNETANVINYAIDNYEIVNINNYIKKNIDIGVNKCENSVIQLVPREEIRLPLLKTQKDNISVEYELVTNVIAPIDKNKVLAYASVYNKYNKIAIYEYVTQRAYKKISYLQYMQYMIGNYVGLLEIEM